MALFSYVIYRAYLPMALSNCWAFISSFDTGALGLTLRLFLGLIVELLQEIFGICWLMLSGLERSRSPFNSNFVGAFNRGILVKWCGPASYLENENWMKKFTYQRKHKMIYILDTRNRVAQNAWSLQIFAPQVFFERYICEMITVWISDHLIKLSLYPKEVKVFTYYHSTSKI